MELNLTYFFLFLFPLFSFLSHQSPRVLFLASLAAVYYSSTALQKVRRGTLPSLQGRYPSLLGHYPSSLSERKSSCPVRPIVKGCVRETLLIRRWRGPSLLPTPVVEGEHLLLAAEANGCHPFELSFFVL